MPRMTADDSVTLSGTSPNGKNGYDHVQVPSQEEVVRWLGLARNGDPRLRDRYFRMILSVCSGIINRETRSLYRSVWRRHTGWCPDYFRAHLESALWELVLRYRPQARAWFIHYVDRYLRHVAVWRLRDYRRELPPIDAIRDRSGVLHTEVIDLIRGLRHREGDLSADVVFLRVYWDIPLRQICSILKLRRSDVRRRLEAGLRYCTEVNGNA